MVSIHDSRARAISEVLANKTCKKIIDYLAETKSASETDIAKAINLPLNTTEYNIKKMIEAGLIEKTKQFFWSAKGKKISMYQLSNKSIVISPKSLVTNKLISILPVVLLSGILTLAIRYYYMNQFVSQRVMDFAEKSVESASAPQAMTGANELLASLPSQWIWFLSGALFALVIYLILNWRKL